MDPLSEEAINEMVKDYWRYVYDFRLHFKPTAEHLEIGEEEIMGLAA